MFKYWADWLVVDSHAIRRLPRYTQVFLVVEPKFEWDAGAVKRRERAVKRAKIAAAELFRTSPLDDNTQAGSAEGAWVGRRFRQPAAVAHASDAVATLRLDACSLSAGWGIANRVCALVWLVFAVAGEFA